MLRYQTKSTYEKRPQKPTTEVVREVLNEGVAIVKTVIQTKNPNEGLKATDFDVQSLVAAGAADLLSPIGSIPVDTLVAADTASVAGAAIEASNSIVKPVNEETK